MGMHPSRRPHGPAPIPPHLLTSIGYLKSFPGAGVLRNAYS